MRNGSTASAGKQSSQSWPADGLEPVTCCPACGAHTRETLYDGLWDQTFFCAPGRWSLHQCRVCCSAYLDPRPTRDTIHLAYQAYYTHVAAEPAQRPEPTGVRRLMRALANGYRNQRFGAQLAPASRFGPAVARVWPRFRHAIEVELRYLPMAWPGARLLDVGFGDAGFMRRAAEAGWQVEGADLDGAVVANARESGLNVCEGGIEAYVDEPESFDVITMNHVIEHVHEPEQDLALAFSLLKPGGLLYIETPNIEALGHREFGGHWRGLEVPRHLLIFSWLALEACLSHAGFREVKRLPRPGVYARLAASSRAIRAGLDPQREARISLRDRLKDIAVSARAAGNYLCSEYITLIARKP